MPVIKRISNKIEQNVWIKDLAQALSVREEDVLEELSKTSLAREEFVAEEKKEKPHKTRKELLEERLLSLLVRLPENVSLVKQEDLSLFSLEAVGIIDHLKNKTKLNSDLEDRVNYLSLMAETEEEEDPQEELNCCFKEIKSLVLKDKLVQICKDIRVAEQAKDSQKVQKLVEKFCHYSKSKNDLETQIS